MKIIYAICLTLFILGCSTKKEIKVEEIKQVDDLLYIPQSASSYSDVLDSNVSKANQSEFESQYFTVWNIETPIGDKNSVQWAFNTFSNGESYGENLQLHHDDFINNMQKKSNYENYATLNKRAITLTEVDIRAFPTDRPLFRNPEKTGEGFPFDYLQNSLVHANKPLFVTHYSKDKEWVHVFSSFAFGWVKANSIVFLDKKHTDVWQKAQQIFITHENTPMYSLEGEFLFKTKIGMMFALINETKDEYTVLVISKYKNKEPLFLQSKISKSHANKGVLEFTSQNMNLIIGEVSKSNYGWGGMYGQRDCSSSLRDLFLPFGVWLPRNSLQQSKVGNVTSLDGLLNEEKITLIKEKGIAFKTLLYKQGHIVLYVGTYDNKVVVFQNTWGIKTISDGVEGRFVIGKSIFSTLRVGNNLKDYDDDAGLLKNLKSMNTLN